MKQWAIVCLCLCSSLASANTIEEVVVTARQFKIVLVRFQDSHVQNPITGVWYYSEEKAEQASHYEIPDESDREENEQVKG